MASLKITVKISSYSLRAELIFLLTKSFSHFAVPNQSSSYLCCVRLGSNRVGFANKMLVSDHGTKINAQYHSPRNSLTPPSKSPHFFSRRRSYFPGVQHPSTASISQPAPFKSAFFQCRPLGVMGMAEALLRSSPPRPAR